MHDLTTRTISILRKYTRDPAIHMSEATALADLGIDSLDLPIICLDLEDVYGVEIVLEDQPDSVGDLIARVVAGLAAKSVPLRRVPRRRSGWMSTAAVS